MEKQKVCIETSDKADAEILRDLIKNFLSKKPDWKGRKVTIQ